MMHLDCFSTKTYVYFQFSSLFSRREFLLNDLNFSEASIDATKHDEDMDQDSEENLLNDE